MRPCQRCARWLLLPPQRRRPVAGDPGDHPSDEDLSPGTPERKKPLECTVSVYRSWRTAIPTRSEKNSGPPLAVMAALYGVPLTPAESVVGESMIVGALTVSV